MMRSLRKALLMVVCIGAAGAAQADGSESGKRVGFLYYGADGVVIVSVQSPSTSAGCPFGGLMNIPATAASKTAWYSSLMAAKLGNAPVTIDFYSNCTVKGVGFN